MKKAWFIAALLVSIPCLVLVSNATMFAFIGHGFLLDVDTVEGMASARALICWLSAMFAILFVGLGVNV